MATTTPTTPPDVAVDPGRDYHHDLYRAGRSRWRGVLAVLALLVTYVGLTGVLSAGVVFAQVAAGQVTLAELQSGLVPFTPPALLAVNLSATALIPLSMLLERVFFGVDPRRLSSVEGRFRWRVLVRAAALVVPLWLAATVVMSAVGYPGQPPLAWDVSVPLLAVVLLSTWAQAAGEEFGFRGLVTRAVGSWFASSRVAFVVSTLVASLMFTLTHLAADPWLLAYYLVFGACLSVVTWRTGGLEVAVLIHAVNNLLSFGVAALLGGGVVTMDRGLGAGGPFMLIPIAAYVVATVAVVAWAGRRRSV